MKRELHLTIFFLLIVILFSGLAQSKITIGNLSNSINTIYGPGEIMKGWINISIEDEPGDLILEDSLDNSILLLDLLKINENEGGSGVICETKDCSYEYSSNGTFSEKEFNLIFGGKKTFGVSFTGGGVEINDVDFVIESDASSSCSNQIEIIFGDSDIFTLKNPRASSTLCQQSISYGCFNKNAEQIENFRLEDSKEYCQKIDVKAAPSIVVGAWIKKESGNENVTFSLKTSNYEEIPGATCILESNSLDPLGKEIGCQINYLIDKPKDLTLCVKKSSGEGTILIRGYSSNNNPCGFYTGGGNSPTSAYQLFINGMEYASPGIINLTVGEIKTDINLAFNEYISKNYNNADCSSECVVPITFVAKSNQNIKIRELNVDYQKTEGTPSPKREFSEVKKIPPKMSTPGFTIIKIDSANFTVPTTVKKHNITFYIENEKLFKKEIEVQSVPVINFLTPTVSFSAYPTEFKVNVTAFNSTISNYIWRFSDDNINKTTNNEKIKHTFNSTGKYSLEVTVIDAQGRSAKKNFNITIEKPEIIIAMEYNKTKSRLDNLISQSNAYPIGVKKRINELLKLDEVSANLENILRLNASAGEDIEKKNLVLSKLLNISLPVSIFVSSKVNSSFIPNKEAINLEILKEVSGGSYENQKASEYKDYIIAKQLEIVEVLIESQSISAEYDEEIRYLFGNYDIKVLKKVEGNVPYIFVKKMEGFKFDPSREFSEVASGDYYYFRLESNSREIIFSATENINFMDLPIFVSSSLSNIDLSEIPTPIGDGPAYGKIKWGWLSLVLLIVGILAFMLYLFLQSWYKYRYENYLFKGRNNMYNLITFIEAQKKLNSSDSEIFKKLRNTGWSREQINYVIKKYLGKRTGMVEIPIKNPFDFLQESQKDLGSVKPQFNPQNRPNQFPPINKNLPEKKFGPQIKNKENFKDKNTKFNKP